MLLCDRERITDLLYVKYVDSCEKLNPGLVDRTIEAVSGEISEFLAYRYPQPWPQVPQLVGYIAAVFSAYRIVKAITSMVDTEESSDNEWLPLQQQWKRCQEMLEDIAAGRLKLPLEEEHPDREDPSIAVVTRKPVFDLKGF